MTANINRRSLLKSSTFALAGSALPKIADGLPRASSRLIHLNLNENAFGPSSSVAKAIQEQLSCISRYADADLARSFAEQIAAYEHVPVEQIILGEILESLGTFLGIKGGPGGEFIYSTPGYLALVKAASHVGGVGVPVPLDKQYKNDLQELSARITSKSRALYIINPHNPTGTINDKDAFRVFLRSISQRTLVIVDEAYLEYTPDFETRSSVSLVRDGANIIVFRTFDKIHGLAGLPVGYSIVPCELGNALRKEGFGDAEALGRLNIAAASAALADATHVRQVRTAVAEERAKWTAVLDSLKLLHTETHTNFVFFDTGLPQREIADSLRKGGIEIGRTFPPYLNWARITIGLPEENKIAQAKLREVLMS